MYMLGTILGYHRMHVLKYLNHLSEAEKAPYSDFLATLPCCVPDLLWWTEFNIAEWLVGA